MLTLSSSLLHRLRTALVAVLLVVLPLQGVVQWVAGLQGPRHVHSTLPDRTASASAVSLLLARLHAAQPVQLQSLGLARHKATASEQAHAHGSLVHTHGAHDAGVVPVADADEAGSSGLTGVTAFLAWLPLPLQLGAAGGGEAPSHAAPLWVGRVVAPALTPPRA